MCQLCLFSAANYCIPEVCVYFNNKLMRGNRTIKVYYLDGFGNIISSMEFTVQMKHIVLCYGAEAVILMLR